MPTTLVKKKVTPSEIAKLAVAKREIADDLIIHRIANIEAAAQANMELALNQIGELAQIRLALLASRVSAYMKNPVRLQLNAILHQHELELRKSVGPYVDFEIRLTPTLLEVNADEDLLRALFSNLAINARDAMRDATTRKFTIHTLKADHTVIVSVTDTGCGMDEETRQRILSGEEFTSKSGVHSGKGMSHIREILCGLGAHMEIKSAPGLGTAFTIYFPAV